MEGVLLRLGGLAAGLLGGWLTKKAGKATNSTKYRVLSPVAAVASATSVGLLAGEMPDWEATAMFGLEQGSIAVLGYDIFHGVRRGKGEE